MSSELPEKHDIDFEVSSPIEPGTPDELNDEAHRGTQYDVRDMHRLGKRQEFMVRLALLLCSSSLAHTIIEKLPLHVNSWFY
jgi:hypothetical protein